MGEFDDMVSAERRRLDEQAAAENERKAAARSQREAWESGEMRMWQETFDRIQELFSAAVRRLKAEGVQPLPVLDKRPAPRRPLGMEGVDRTVISGYRWRFEGAFALDKQCRAYKDVGAPKHLIPAERWPERSLAKRTLKFLRDRGLMPGVVTAGPQTHVSKLVDKSLLRTGLSHDQLVLWDMSGEPIDFDPAEAVRSGRIHCFGKADDGTPLLLSSNSDHEPETLEAFMARAVARSIARDS